ncbi:MAG TPA: CBS domain-containing protein, partial [Pyrinomonadaceae bacterium]|nr:CBS domain-containing protein [Pyrinomonadaceae bacterium]
MNCPSCGHENIDGVDRCDNCLASFRQLDIPSADAAEGLARSVMEDNLNRLDHDEAVFVAPDTPALEVARLMRARNTGCALVLDRGKLVGIFTEHDVLKKMAGGLSEPPAGGLSEPPAVAGDLSEPPALAGGPHWATSLVKDLMSRNPETLNEKDSVAEALNKMSL